MRSLALLALAALATLPLTAHDHWRDRRPVAVVEESCRPAYRWETRRYEDRRWDDRWERPHHHGRHARRYVCDEDRVVLRPLPRFLPPPILGRVELHFR